MYLRDKKKLIFGIIIIIIIAIGVFFSIREETKRINGNEVTQNDNKDIEDYIKEVDLVLFNKDKSIKWNLNSERLSSIEQGDFYEMTSINFKAIEEENEIYNGIGKKAQYDNKEEILTVFGEITINKKDIILKTNQIKWLQQQNEIKGLDGVVLKSPELIINAKEFQSDSSLERIVFKGDKNSQAKLEWR